jgi:hypothetical protein
MVKPGISGRIILRRERQRDRAVIYIAGRDARIVSWCLSTGGVERGAAAWFMG